MPGLGLTAASAKAPADHHPYCPAAESLVPGTTFHHKSLAPGVIESVGNAKDSRGTVNMHILTVDLTQKGVKVKPLMHSLGERLPLSTLAAGQPRLVAATNTGYFDFQYGAPTDPLIVNSQPLVMSDQHQKVVGFGANGRLEAGNVWMTSSLTAGSKTHSIHAVNETYPPDGIGVYNSHWGQESVPGRWSTQSRSVTGNTVSSSARSGRGITVPSGGYLLQSRGRAATNWLSSVATGTKVGVTTTVHTDAPEPFVQAYGVGVQIVAKTGQAISGFNCNSANTKTPARTAIGWSHGGRTMVIALVADHFGTTIHGLDDDQMSKLMAQLGVSQAYEFDGSGSTELLAKLPGSSGLTLQTFPADGQERPMPVGLGISVHPVKVHRKH